MIKFGVEKTRITIFFGNNFKISYTQIHMQRYTFPSLIFRSAVKCALQSPRGGTGVLLSGRLLVIFSLLCLPFAKKVNSNMYVYLVRMV
jgi:hypothetical protein